MGLCSSKSAPTRTVEDPVLTKPPNEEPKVEPAAEAPQSTPTPTGTPAETTAAEPEPAAKPEPAAMAATGAPKVASDAAAAAANVIVKGVVEEAITMAELAEAEAVAKAVVDEVLSSCLASENPISTFLRKTSKNWSATTGAVGDFFKNLTPRGSQADTDEKPKPNILAPLVAPFKKEPPTGLDTPRAEPLVDIPADETPLISGFLVKKASGFPFNWLKRYCVFYASTKTLAYYVTEAEALTKTNIKGQRAVITGVSVLEKEPFAISFVAAEGKPLFARCGVSRCRRVVEPTSGDRTGMWRSWQRVSACLSASLLGSVALTRHPVRVRGAERRGADAVAVGAVGTLRHRGPAAVRRRRRGSRGC